MDQRTTARVLSAVTLAFLAACGQRGATGPTGTTGADEQQVGTLYRPVRIVSGADLQPVVGAEVTINGEDGLVSDARGEVTSRAPGGVDMGAAVDVTAPGFLPRQTRLDPNRTVVLWPAATEAEAEAIHRMVYPAGDLREPTDSSPITLSVIGADGETLSAWLAAAESFGAPYGLQYRPATSFQYDVNELSVVVGHPTSCEPIPEWGSCRDSPYYQIYVVLPERARDPETMRRVLASWFLAPNPLPGLLNARAPEPQLSALEAQAIRMILLRPLPNHWPDRDR